MGIAEERRGRRKLLGSAPVFPQLETGFLAAQGVPARPPDADPDHAGRIVKLRLTLHGCHLAGRAFVPPCRGRDRADPTVPGGHFAPRPAGPRNASGRGRSSIFFRVLHEFRGHLDGLHATNHCAAMNGLNHICGICPEIIS
jgi:hypothetical protein